MTSNGAVRDINTNKLSAMTTEDLEKVILCGELQLVGITLGVSRLLELKERPWIKNACFFL